MAERKTNLQRATSRPDHAGNLPARIDDQPAGLSAPTDALKALARLLARQAMREAIEAQASSRKPITKAS